MTAATPTRPALRYLGGKWKDAPRIASFFPAHQIYVEPFGGGGSVLIRKERARGEVYNDLDGDVVNLFRVLRDREQAAELERLLRLTPYARAEFMAAYAPAEEPVERARRLVVRSFMGHGSCASRADRSTGFRLGAREGDAWACRDWASWPDAMGALSERLQGVVVEEKPAQRLIAERDGTAVLFYVDPPYVHATRSAKRTRCAPSNGYTHELTDAEHVALLEQLDACAGMVALSGYAHPIYDERLRHWRRETWSTLADGARPRIEVLWLNPALSAALEAERQRRAGGLCTPLFGGVAA